MHVVCILEIIRNCCEEKGAILFFVDLDIKYIKDLKYMCTQSTHWT